MIAQKSSPRRASKRGFTLVEVMLVVVIIGTLAMLCYPMIARSRSNAAGARFINDLRNAVHAFELYALQTGYYPEDTAPGVMPVGMEEVLRRPSWDKETPIGGRWDWSMPEGGEFYAGVVISNPTFTPAMLQIIDQRFDDGSLTSGSFQTYNDGVVYIIE